MRKKALFILPALLLLASCATGGSTGAPPAVSGTMGLDEALAAAVRAVEAKIPSGTEIAVYDITSPSGEISAFFLYELDNAFSAGGKFVLLARKDALAAVEAEHQFQMSGLVSDESAVGIGHYLGAKVVVTGTFDRYADFSRLRIRAVDVRSSVVAAMFTARIDNNDPVLAGVTSPLGNSGLAVVSESALAFLDSGKDLYAEGKLDEALGALDAALAADKNLPDAYFYRGTVYALKGDYNRAIADWSAAIRINPNDSDTYYNRGTAYANIRDYDKAIADYTAALRINPNNALAYNNRGSSYGEKGDNDRAIADYNAALRINPNNAGAYYNRAYTYHILGDYDKAIADNSEAIRINPNYSDAYRNRGVAYYFKGQLDRAIADFNKALQINPDDGAARNNLDIARRERGY